MELLHMCRLCLKNSDYHFNIFTEIISNNHLYQLINKICELGILSKLKEKEQVEDAVDSAFDQSTINQATIKREIGIDEIAIPAEQVTIEKIIEMDVIASLEHLNEMETILAGKEKSVSQEKTYPCCEASLRRSAHVCGALLKGCICQLAIKNETDIGEIVIPAEQIEILKITEMERSASFEHFNELEIIPAVIEKSESKEAHFTNEQFELNRVDGIRKLKPNANTTIFSHRLIKLGRKPPAERSTIDGITISKRRKQQDSNTSCEEFPTPMQGFPVEDPGNEKGADDMDLHDKVVELTRKLDLARKEQKKLKIKYEKLKQRIGSIFNEDQLNEWSRSCVGHIRFCYVVFYLLILIVNEYFYISETLG